MDAEEPQHAAPAESPTIAPDPTPAPVRLRRHGLGDVVPDGVLVARTIAIPADALPADLGDLLPETGGLSWLRRGDGLVAWGEATRITTHGPERFARTDAAWRVLAERAVVRDEVRLPGTGPLGFGSFAFADDSPAGGVLVVPQVVVGRRGSDAWVTTVALDGVPASGAELVAERAAAPAPNYAGAVVYDDGALGPREWQRVVAAAVGEIRAGALDKVVLARDVVARTAEPIDRRRLLDRLAASYPSCWTFSVDTMVGATPELLVRSEKGLVTSRVLAGTIRRTGDDDADLAHAAILAHSSKDLEEHEYAVTSLSHALEPFCSSMNVPETPFVLHLPNVLHLATDVAGVLAEPVSSLRLAAALHPTAAVAGTPTPVARALIARIEGMDRARYAGPVGWIGVDGDGEWGIALRSAELDPADPRRMRLFAGCGVVAASDPSAEYAESEAKLEPMRHALG